MELAELVATAVSFLFSLAISWALMAPFFAKEEEGNAGEESRELEKESLLRRKDMLFESLEDLELERAGGKIDENHYESSKAELTKQTSDCLSSLDSLEESSKAALKQADSDEDANGTPQAA